MKNSNCGSSASQPKSSEYTSAEDLAKALSNKPLSGWNSAAWLPKTTPARNTGGPAEVPSLTQGVTTVTRPLPTLPEAIRIVSIELQWELFNLAGEPATSCLSPFRKEFRPSLSVFVGEDGKTRFNDFGDATVYGDSFDFFLLCTGLNSSEAAKPFRELAAKIRKGEIEIPLGGGRPAAVERIARVRPLTDSERKQMLAAARALVLSPDRQQQIATARGWDVATIFKLANEGSLGWSERSLGFIYATGLKLRWQRGEERHIWWRFGNASSLWRQDRLAAASTIYITEGETDAISLIDAGIEEIPDTAVIALPSANTFMASWALLFTGKNVVLCLDADEAGEKATIKIGRALRPHAKSLKQVKLKEVFSA